MHGGGGFPSSKGAISFSPFNPMKGGDSMYITLVELLMLLSLLLALVDFFDRRK